MIRSNHVTISFLLIFLLHHQMSVTFFLVGMQFETDLAAISNKVSDSIDVSLMAQVSEGMSVR